MHQLRFGLPRQRGVLSGLQRLPPRRRVRHLPRLPGRGLHSLPLPQQEPRMRAVPRRQHEGRARRRTHHRQLPERALPRDHPHRHGRGVRHRGARRARGRGERDLQRLSLARPAQGAHGRHHRRRKQPTAPTSAAASATTTSAPSARRRSWPTGRAGRARPATRWDPARRCTRSTAPTRSRRPTPSGCADTDTGCHEGDDLHAMHADAPKTCSGSSAEGEPACHALGVDALAPSATSCGGTAEESCHRAGTSGTYEHENGDVHAPTSRAASRATFSGVACGACHQMSPDGRSLIAEHALATSEMTLVPDDGCRNCHNTPASATAVEDEWPSSSTSFACEACHGREGLDAVHARGHLGLARIGERRLRVERPGLPPHVRPQLGR